MKTAVYTKAFKINLVASDTGSYGLDIGMTFPELLDQILSFDERIVIQFIQDLHPKWICSYKRELLDIIRTKRIRSILTAVQSGSQRISKLMRRQNNLKEYFEALQAMKKCLPGLRLRTQVIIGFPTETETDLLETIDFLKRCEFDELDIFHYYETPTMDSAKFFPKINERVIRERVIKLYNSLPVTMIKRSHQIFDRD